MDADTLHRGDANPRRYGLLEDLGADDVVDMSDADAVLTLRVRERGMTEILATIVCTKLDPTWGFFYFDWPTGLWTEDIDDGRYEMESVWTSADDREQTVNEHVWDGHEYDPSTVYPIKLKEGFGI